LASFAASRIKIARAQKHLAELADAIRAFVESRPATFAVDISGPIGSQRAAIHFNIERLPPDELSAIIGDVIHNLRSALDLAACDLVRAKEGSQARVGDVYFPICRRAEDLDDMIRRRGFDRAGEQAVALLRSLKPYAGSEGNGILRALHDLDIQDKHTALIVTPMAVAGPVLSRWDDDGTPNLTVVGDPTTFSELKLAFGPGLPLAGVEVLGALQSFVDQTTSIVEAFRALLGSGTV
jgi:hypothetical protein